MDGIIRQGKKLGTHFYIYSGGEPLLRKQDIIRLCEAHPECAFMAFTNGTLIDEAFADDMLRVKNFVPAISVEGFEAATDARRGKGTYRRVEKAMALLQRKRLPFGISLCYTSQNVDVIGSDAFIDHMIGLGALFAWFFTYMPVGRDAVSELMVSAEQREFMYHTIRGWRDTRPLFTMDFWNDGEFVGGCIAGGRSSLHINAGGDIEPCAFIHYADAISARTRCWRRISGHVHAVLPQHPSTTTCSAPARCWITRAPGPHGGRFRRRLHRGAGPGECTYTVRQVRRHGGARAQTAGRLGRRAHATRAMCAPQARRPRRNSTASPPDCLTAEYPSAAARLWQPL